MSVFSGRIKILIHDFRMPVSRRDNEGYTLLSNALVTLPIAVAMGHGVVREYVVAIVNDVLDADVDNSMVDTRDHMGQLAVERAAQHHQIPVASIIDMMPRLTKPCAATTVVVDVEQSSSAVLDDKPVVVMEDVDDEQRRVESAHVDDTEAAANNSTVVIDLDHATGEETVVLSPKPVSVPSENAVIIVDEDMSPGGGGGDGDDYDEEMAIRQTEMTDPTTANSVVAPIKKRKREEVARASQPINIDSSSSDDDAVVTVIDAPEAEEAADDSLNSSQSKRRKKNKASSRKSAAKHDEEAQAEAAKREPVSAQITTALTALVMLAAMETYVKMDEEKRKIFREKYKEARKPIMDYFDTMYKAYLKARQKPHRILVPRECWFIKNDGRGFAENLEAYVDVLIEDAFRRAAVVLRKDASREQEYLLAKRLSKYVRIEADQQRQLLPFLNYVALVMAQKITHAVDVIPKAVLGDFPELCYDWSVYIANIRSTVENARIYEYDEERASADDVEEPADDDGSSDDNE